MKRTNLAMIALVAAGLLVLGAPLRAQQSGMGMRDMPMGPGTMTYGAATYASDRQRQRR